MDKRKRLLNESSRSSLLQGMEFSICSDIRDMVKLRNDKSRPVLKEKSKKELFSRTLMFELKQLSQYEKVMAKYEFRSALFKYQMMAIQNLWGMKSMHPNLILATQISFVRLRQLTAITSVIQKNSE